MKFESVIDYLQSYSTLEPPYDPNGALHLLKAIVDNLQDHATEQDLEDYAGCLDTDNQEFLRTLLAHLAQ